jgi:hypothetical protein
MLLDKLLKLVPMQSSNSRKGSAVQAEGIKSVISLSCWPAAQVAVNTTSALYAKLDSSSRLTRISRRMLPPAIGPSEH